MATFTNNWDETAPLDNSTSGNNEAGKIDVIIRQMKLDIRERILKFMPVGMVVKWPSPIIPYGFKECNGESLSRVTYPDLFTVIGTVHGAVDGTHFSLPKMSGYFARGWNHSKLSGLYDPAASSRLASTAAGATMSAGDHVGTTQADDNKPHTHQYYYPVLLGAGSDDGISIYEHGSSWMNTGSSGTENRPSNIYFKFIIRVDDEFSDGSYSYIRTWDEATPISADYMGRMSLELRKLRTDVEALINNFFPPGMVIYWPGSTCPDGYVELNGQALDRTIYADLYNEIEDMYGPGDGYTTFNVPDVRGLFIRAHDNGAGVDSLAASRTTGDAVGSLQTDDNKAHTHSYIGSDLNHNGGVYQGIPGAPAQTWGSGQCGKSPTRIVDAHPKNIYLMAIMKAKKVV